VLSNIRCGLAFGLLQTALTHPGVHHFEEALAKRAIEVGTVMPGAAAGVTLKLWGLSWRRLQRAGALAN
jgi:hypothetical protein